MPRVGIEPTGAIHERLSCRTQAIRGKRSSLESNQCAVIEQAVTSPTTCRLWNSARFLTSAAGHAKYPHSWSNPRTYPPGHRGGSCYFPGRREPGHRRLAQNGAATSPNMAQMSSGVDCCVNSRRLALAVSIALLTACEKDGIP